MSDIYAVGGILHRILDHGAITIVGKDLRKEFSDMPISTILLQA